MCPKKMTVDTSVHFFLIMRDNTVWPIIFFEHLGLLKKTLTWLKQWFNSENKNDMVSGAYFSFFQCIKVFSKSIIVFSKGIFWREYVN